MEYQTLTPEQFQKARSAGFSTEKIIEMEQKRKSEMGGGTSIPQEIHKPIITSGMGIGVGTGVGPVDLSKQIGDIGGRIKESVTSLPLRLKEDVVAGAEDMQKGNILKGIVKSGFRTAGDVAGTIFSPISSTMGVATEEIGKATGLDKPVGKAINWLGDQWGTFINETPVLRDFVAEHPNLEKDISRALDLAMATGVKGDIANIPEIAKKSIESGIEYGKGKVQDIYSNIKSGGIEAKNNLVNNLNETFKKGTIGVKNIADYADERGIDLGKEIVDRGIKPIVENDRLKFGTEPFKKLDAELASDSMVIDEAIKQYPDTRVSANELVKDIKRQIANDPILKRQGAVPDVSGKAIEKINDFIEQEGTSDFTLEQIQSFKKGMWEASKKFKMTETGKSDAFSELGKLFKNIIETEVPDVRIKDINIKIGRTQEVYKMLNKINSLQDGGIVLKGGKLGKYFNDLIGTGVGAITGTALGGPVGGAFGAGVGYNISSLLRSLSQKSAILGPIDRVLIKFAEKIPENTAIRDAKIFIEDVKAGKQPTITPSVQKTIEEAWAKKEAVLPPDEVYEMEMGVYKLGKTPVTGIVEPTGQYRDPSKGVNFFPSKSKPINKSLNLSPKVKGADNLTLQAKKYGSAEEFVKAQTNLQHGTSADFTEFKKVDPSKGEAIYLSDKGQAKAKAIASRGGKLMDIAVDESRVKTFDPRIPNTEIDSIVQSAIDKVHGKGKYQYNPEASVETRNIINKVDDVLQAEVIRQASKKGYNDFRFYERGTKEYSRAITDNSLIKTKSQLTDIWNKANKITDKKINLAPKLKN